MAVAIAFLAGHSLCAEDLTGKWVVTPAPPNAEIAYSLTATGNTFAGYLSQGQTNSAITGGKIDGDNVTFNVMRQTGNNVAAVTYTAKIAPDGLSITVPPVGGLGGRGRGPAFGFGAPPVGAC